MDLRSISGLPAHALIVHGAVVLLPLAAILVIVAAVVPKFRRVAAPVALAMAAVATLFVFLAEQSGETLKHQVKETPALEDHTEMADAVLPWSLLLTFVAAAGTVVVVAGPKLTKPSPKVVTAALVGISLVAGVGATVTVVQVGHSGAKATWGTTAQNPQRDEGGDRGGSDGD